MKRVSAPSRPAATRARTAVLESALVLVAWVVFASMVSGGQPVLAYDSFRDMAYAHGILAGGLGRDPTFAGLPAWYPPGNPLAFALLSRLTGVPVNSLYFTSLFWLGWVNPLAVFWLARLSWGRLAAWLALPCVLLGSYWWLVHAAMQMPSVQGVGLTLVTLIAWRHARNGNPVALTATAALAALTAWVHPLCGAFALGTITLHGVLAPLLAAKLTREPVAKSLLAMRACGVAVAGGLLALPALAVSLRGPVANIAPRHWFAPELHDPRFALHAHSPLVWIPGVAGLLMAWREWHQHGWLAAWFLLAVSGMLAGYAAHDLGWPVPWLVPHEFQWHAQLALTLAAALAIARSAGWFAERAKPSARGRVGWALALLALAVGPGIFALPASRSFLLLLDDRWRGLVDTASRLREQTAADAVIAAPPDVSYFIAGFSGLRAVALPAGHANPAVDAIARIVDAESLLTTRDPARFVRLSTMYRVSALLLPPELAEPPRGPSAVLAGWPILEPLALPVSAWRAYRVRGNGREGIAP